VLLDLDFFSSATALLAWLSGLSLARRPLCLFRRGARTADSSSPTASGPIRTSTSAGCFEVLRQGRGEPRPEISALEFAPVAPLPPRRRFQPAAQDSANVERLLARPGSEPATSSSCSIRTTGDLGASRWQMADERYVELAKLILVKIPRRHPSDREQAGATAAEKLEAAVGRLVSVR